MGTLVTDASTWLHNIDIPMVPAGDGYIDLEIDFLNLLPGRYYFTLWIDSALNHKIFEMIEHAVHLDIEEAPVYNSSRHLDSRYGLVYFPQRWHLDGLGTAQTLEISPAANG
jgi:hypothetical protein